jgi:hypothetical protein
VLFDVLKEFNQTYEGTKTATEEMHLEYQALIQDHPELTSHLSSLPGAFFSGRKRPAKGTHGVFFCYALLALDKESGEFTEPAGTTRWYLYEIDKKKILEEPGEIIESLRCKPNAPRRCVTDEKLLKDIRTSVLKHIKDTYLKRVDAPVGVKPVLKCWMEINDG